MTMRRNSFVTGTLGTTISAANSAGQGQDGYNTVSIGASATLTYDDTNRHSDQFSAKYVISGTTANTATLRYDTGLTLTEVWTRKYFFMAALPTVTINLMRLYGATATLLMGCNIIITTGVVRLLDGATTTIASTTTPIVANEWNRIDTHLIVSTGAADIQLYPGNALCDAPRGSATGGASISGTVTTGTNVQELRWGSNVAAATAIGTFWLDDIAISDVGAREVGPYIRPFTNMPSNMAAQMAAIW